jgi:hypothetical protein
MRFVNRLRSTTVATAPGISLILPHVWLLALVASASLQPCSAAHIARSRQVFGITAPCETLQQHAFTTTKSGALSECSQQRQILRPKNTKSDEHAPAPEHSQDAAAAAGGMMDLEQCPQHENRKLFRLKPAHQEGEGSQRPRRSEASGSLFSSLSLSWCRVLWPGRRRNGVIISCFFHSCFFSLFTSACAGMHASA